MKYISVCSGIEAATAAWHSLGWEAAWYSEVDAFPSAVLAHRYPNTPNRGDMTKFLEWPDATVDLLVGGTPCQSFSIAGLRKGLADPRGNLMLTYLAIADQYRPRWLVWENVPGVLSSNGGRDFGALLGGLGKLGYGFAYRVLDAQYFGVPQRRRRVFVIGCLGDWRRAAAVLFERHSLQGHPAPSRQARQGAAQPVAECLRAGGNRTGGDRPPGTDADTAGTYLLPVAHALRGEGFDASEDGTGRGTPLVPVCFSAKDHGALTTGGGKPGQGVPTAVLHGMKVRRLTPRECERLQGFDDDYTLIPYRGKQAADGPRYKALGNSMAVPVMRWLGERVAEVERLTANAGGEATGAALCDRSPRP